MADVEKLRKVKQCMDSLAEGLNPFTGQPLPEEDVVLYSEEAQRFIVDNVDAIVSFAADKGSGTQR